MNTTSGQTKLVAVLGNPVRHSISPVIHNAAFAEMSLDWSYMAIPCKSEDLKEITNALIKMECIGLNLTIPHKQNAINLCEKITSIAKQIGAVNTLIANKNGSWNGANTDIEGFIAPLNNKSWENKKALILGCGGSARSVFMGLKLLNLKEVIIIGRNEKKIKKFILDMNSKVNLEKDQSIKLLGITQENMTLIEHIENADLIVNTTPIGMATNSDLCNDLPLGSKVWEHLTNRTTLYDLIYTPRPTAFLKTGAKINCETIDGLEMLIQQGAASLRLWSGKKEIPITVMRQAALNYLN